MVRKSGGEWLIANLDTHIIKGAVLEVWDRLPEEERAVLRALKPLIFEADLSGYRLWGLHEIYETSDDRKNRLILVEKTLDYSDAARIVAHEFAHVILRHGEYTAGDLGLEGLEEFVEDQARRLQARWGFPAIDPGREAAGDETRDRGLK